MKRKNESKGRSESLMSFRSVLWLLLFGLLTACGGDDYHYPSVQLEFLTAATGADGTLTQVTTDAGETWPVLNDHSSFRSTPDSLLRIVSNYLITPDAAGRQGAELYAVRKAIAPLPKPAAEFEQGIKTDGAELLSSWMGNGYFNLLFTIKQQSKTHRFHFVEQEVTYDEATGRCRLSLLLYHDADDDVEAYSARAYLSVPLSHYLIAGITQIEVTLTYKNYQSQQQTITAVYSL